MGAFDGFFKTVGDAAHNVGQVAGQLGQAVGRQQLVPGMPGSPTVGAVAGPFINAYMDPTADIPKGLPAIPAVAGAFLGTPNPADPASYPKMVASDVEDLAKGAGVAKEAGPATHAVTQIVDKDGNVIAGKVTPVVESTGGKYVAVDHQPIGQTSTPAQVKATVPNTQQDFSYVPPTNTGLDTKYATNEPTTPLVQNQPTTEPAAQLAQTPATTQAIPGERTFPFDKANPSKDDTLASQKRNIRIDGHDVKTNDVQQINSTLNGYGIKGTNTQQLQATANTIGDLQNQAKNIVARQGGTVEKSGIIANTTKGLSYNAKSNIPPMQAQKAADDYIDNLYVRAMGGDVTQPIQGMVPDQIPGHVLQDMKTFANEDAQGTFSQTDPTKWTEHQTVSRHARDAIDAALDAKYPDASRLNNDMSDLYKAQDSLTKGANQEGDAAQKLANTPKQPLNLGDKLMGPFGKQVFPGNVVAGGINKLTNTPTAAGLTGAALLGGAATGGILEGPQLVNSFNKQSQSYAGSPDGNGQQGKGGIHGSSVPQRYSLPQGFVPFKDATDTYTNQQNSYTKAIAADKARIASGDTVGGNQALANDQGALDQLNNSWANNAPMRSAGVNLEKVTGLSNIAVPLIQKANLSVLNSLNGSYDALLNSQNKDNVALGKALQNVQQLTGVNLSNVKSKEALIAGLDQAYNIIKQSYDSVATGKNGSSAPQAPAIPATGGQSSGGPQIGTPIDYGNSINGGQPAVAQ